MSTERLSHYELLDLLGAGGMGRVYRARDLVLDRIVAIKRITEAGRGDPDYRARFRREARLAAQLNHPNIATIYEFGEENGEVFLVMEFVEGRTLRQILASGAAPIDRVRQWGRQTARALAAAHARGIVHRDIKPENLMWTPDELLKVMDFGVARRSGETQLTMEGQLVGTPRTMAPEIVRGEPAGPAADLFALGCVLYESLAGQPPFAGADPLAVLYQITHADPAPLRSLRAEVPADLAELITGLLHKDPSRRPGSAQAIAASRSLEAPARLGLEPEATDETLPLPHPAGGEALRTVGSSGTSPTATARRIRSRRLRRMGGVALVAAVGGALAFAWWPRGDPEARHQRAVQLNDRAFRIRAESTAVAQRLLEEAVRLDPAFATPWNNLGDLARRAGDLEGALRAFRHALTLDPDRADARLNVAATLAALDRPVEAEAAYRNVLEGNSDVAWVAANNLGHLLLEQRRGAAAESVLVPAVERWPRVPSLWKNLGIARLASGDRDRARQALETSLRLDPSNADARVALEYALGNDASTTQEALPPAENVRLDSARARLHPLMRGLGIPPAEHRP